MNAQQLIDKHTKLQQEIDSIEEEIQVWVKNCNIDENIDGIYVKDDIIATVYIDGCADDGADIYKVEINGKVESWIYDLYMYFFKKLNNIQ